MITDPLQLTKIMIPFQNTRYYPRLLSVIDLHGNSIDFVQPSRRKGLPLHFFFPLLLLSWCSVSSAYWLINSCLDHSLCSCWSKPGVNSPSLTRRLARVLSPLGPLLALGCVGELRSAVLLLLSLVCPGLLFCVCSGLVMLWFVALMRRVILLTPCWMISSSSCWISRTNLVSGNMSMKR